MAVEEEKYLGVKQVDGVESEGDTEDTQEVR